VRRLSKAPKPDVLEGNAEKWTSDYLAAVGDPAIKTKPTPWKHKNIKDALAVETSDRCAYCDGEMKAYYPGDVEHILPKSLFPEKVVEWENLTLACYWCNNEKKDWYSAHNPLLNPYDDDPEEHLLFWGDLVLAQPGSLRGEVTVRQLKLYRQELVLARRERIEAVHQMVSNWAKAPEGEVADVLRGFILEDYEEGAFKSSVRGLLVQFKVI
jgi:hypothetical protein